MLDNLNFINIHVEKARIQTSGKFPKLANCMIQISDHNELITPRLMLQAFILGKLSIENKKPDSDSIYFKTFFRDGFVPL